MVLINEWLPNPTGSDAENEWIELFNNGDETIALQGWKLKNEQGKTFIFKHHTIAPHNFLVLPRSETKLTLRNQDGALFLYNHAGALVDEASFFGLAKEAASVVRDAKKNSFFREESTPGAANSITALSTQKTTYDTGVPLRRSGIAFGELLLLAVLVAFFIAFVMLYATTRGDALSHTFFERNKKSW